MKAIETSYKGYRFRSRLEARWAVFFDALGIKWEYEKEGYRLWSDDRREWINYLPDFCLYNIKCPELKCYIEVKPSQVSEDEEIKARALARASNVTIVIVQGDPLDVSGKVFSNFSIMNRKSRAALLYVFRVCLGDDFEDEYEVAATKARSARFEFGEVPR